MAKKLLGAIKLTPKTTTGSIEHVLSNHKMFKSASALSTALELREGLIEGEAPDSLLTFPKQSKTPLMTDMLHKKKEANEHDGEFNNTLHFALRGLMSGGLAGAVSHNNPNKSRWGSALKGGLIGAGIGAGGGSALDHYENQDDATARHGHAQYQQEAENKNNAEMEEHKHRQEMLNHRMFMYMKPQPQMTQEETATHWANKALGR